MSSTGTRVRALRRAGAAGFGGLLLTGLVASPAWGVAPDAPAKPTVTRGSTELTVAFTAPNDNGTPIASYTATCTSSDGGAGPASDTQNATTITVTGLTNGKTYTCTVHAGNVLLETGPESPPSDPIVPADVPDPPTKPTATPGNRSAVVAFTPPMDNGSAITSYTAACTSSNGGAFGSTTGPASPITVSSLTTNKNYSCTVAATNGVGDSNESPNSDPVVPAGVPDAPMISGVVRGNASVAVSFTVPSDNGNPITSFSATCTSSNGGVSGTKSGMTALITVTGLTNARTYRCTARAANTYGSGPPSAPSAQVIPATAPNAPKVGSPDPGDGSARVNLTPPSGNGAAVTSYNATCTSSDGGASGSGSGPAAPVVVTGLTNGHLYSCTATATNAIGTSAESIASPSFVVGVPGRPTIDTVVSGSTTGATGALNISITPGAANGAPVTTYHVTCRPATTGVARTAASGSSSLVVGGLDTGKAYLCTAATTNARGDSRDSATVRAVVGTPGPPRITKVAQLSHGLAFAFLGSAANGRPIIDYRAQCKSSNGGADQSVRDVESPLSASNLTVGGSYTCVLTGRNSRGEGSPTTVGPIVVQPPSGNGLASCSGNSGTMTIDPSMQQKPAQAHTFDLKATFTSCKGAYVNAARASFSLRTKRAANCGSVVGLVTGGSGSLFWTSPLGMGKSRATIHLKITTTGNHQTKATYFGTITSGNSIFRGAHVKGALTLGRGFHPSSTGGDCTSQTGLARLPVTAMTLVLS